VPIPDREQHVRDNPHFLREEEVLGFRTLVMGYGYSASDLFYFERYLAPRLDFAEIKKVTAGSWGISVVEPLSIEIDSVIDGAFRARPEIDPQDEEYVEKISEQIPEVFPEVYAVFEEYILNQLAGEDPAGKSAPVQMEYWSLPR